jgi:hypothetical protein
MPKKAYIKLHSYISITVEFLKKNLNYVQLKSNIVRNQY